MKKSLRIKGLDPRAPYGDMARLIVRDRLRRVHRLAREYLRTPDSTGLSSLRTAISRVRFPLECFVDCFPRRLFNAALDQIVTLQRATEQLVAAEAMIDGLRTRQVASSTPHDLGESPEPQEALESEETVVTLTQTEFEANLIELEAERAHRLEAFDGVLKAILESDDLKRFRRSLRD